MARYVIDPLHSDIEFKVKHLMISNINGRFSKFKASMDSDREDFTDAKIFFIADIDSICTGVLDRDNHLKSSDFFDVESYPNLSFTSSEILKNETGEYIIDGLMTIKGVTKNLQLKAHYNGCNIDDYGDCKYGFEIIGNLLRKDYDLCFNGTSSAGSLLVDNSIKLIINVQMTKEKNV